MLALCADAGLVTVGVIAIDGTKLHANANRDRDLDYQQITEAIVAEADRHRRGRDGGVG